MSNLVDKAMELQVMTCLDSLLDRANHDEYLGRIGKKEALKFLEENRQYVEIIKLRLRRLEAIDNANPSKALECLEKLKGMEISSMPFSDEYGTQEVDLNDIRKVGSQLNTDFREYTTTIEQALIKAEKEHKALEIIKEKIGFKFFDRTKEIKIYLVDGDGCVYLRNETGDTLLPEEEFELLRSVLEC